MFDANVVGQAFAHRALLDRDATTVQQRLRIADAFAAGVKTAREEITSRVEQEQQSIQQGEMISHISQPFPIVEAPPTIIRLDPRVALERRKQVFQKGYTPEHDDKGGLEHLAYHMYQYGTHDQLIAAAGLAVAAYEHIMRKVKRREESERPVE